MRLVVLTNDDSVFGLTILNEMKRRGMTVDAVVALAQPLGYSRQLFKWVSKRVGILQAVYFAVRRVIHGIREARTIRAAPDFITDFEELAERVFRTVGTNSQQTLDALRGLEPDVIVIGQTGIVREKLIQVPRCGILNGHPGILPDYRGIDSACWALLNDEPDKIGVTVHWVDPGVDTGPIVQQRRVGLDELGDVGALALDDALFRIASSELADVARSIDPDNPPPGVPQPRRGGRQYYKMRLGQEREVRRKLKQLL